MQVLVDSAPGLGRKGGVGAAMPMRPRSTAPCKLLPPEKISKTFKVGSSPGRIVGTQGTTWWRCRFEDTTRRSAKEKAAESGFSF
jgi:hypothetical protein